jgi:hypothetical protein
LVMATMLNGSVFTVTPLWLYGTKIATSIVTLID